MSELHRLDVPNETGHLTLTWDPADETAVEAARAEFSKLKAAGFAFYATDGKEVRRITAKASTLEVRVIKEFKPEVRQTVAIRPMAGG
jgi:hypothetical protein